MNASASNSAYLSALILGLCIQLSSLPQSVHGQSENVITIGADHNPPFRIIKDGKYTGIYGEMIHEITKGMNLKVKMREIPFTRALTELKNGEIDVFLALVKRPDREKYLYYCQPPIKKRTDRAFYLRPGEENRIQKYDDLYGKQIGMLRGVKLTRQFDEDQKLQKQPVTTHEQNFRKLLAKRIDTFVHTEIAMDYQIKLLGYADRIQKAPYRFTQEQPTYFVISQKSKYLARAPEFEKNLKRLHEEKAFWKLVALFTDKRK